MKTSKTTVVHGFVLCMAGLVSASAWSSDESEREARVRARQFQYMQLQARAEHQRVIENECSGASPAFKKLMGTLGAHQTNAVAFAHSEIESWSELTGEKQSKFGSDLESEKVWKAAEVPKTPETPGQVSPLTVALGIHVGFQVAVGVTVGGVILGAGGLAMGFAIVVGIPALVVGTAAGSFLAGSWLSGPLSGGLQKAQLEAYRLEKTDIGHVLKVDTGVSTSTPEADALQKFEARIKQDQKLFREAHARLRRGFDREMKKEDGWFDYSRKGAEKVAQEEARDQALLYDLEFKYYRAMFQLAGAYCSGLEKTRAGAGANVEACRGPASAGARSKCEKSGPSPR